MPTTDQLQTIAAYAALVISLWAGYMAYRVGQEQVRLDAHMLRIETSRERDRVAQRASATLRASLVSGSDSSVLQIRNEGESGAWSIEVTADGSDLHDHPCFTISPPLPTELDSGAQVDARMFVYDGMPQQSKIELTWTDNRGSGQRWSSTVSLII